MASTVMRAPAARAARPRPRGLAGLGFLLPFLIVFAATVLAPLAYSIGLSLFSTRLIGGTQFVGADNFLRVLTDGQFWDGFLRVALFLVVQVPIMLGIALVGALAIDSARLYAGPFFRIVMFLPYAVPGVVAALMWGFMYGDRIGLVGNLNDVLGAGTLQPFSPQWMLASIGNVVTWEFAGYNMLIFYSALKTIPAELYEAAEIDGASQLRIVRAVKLPAVRGAVAIAVIFSIIGSFQLFNEPSIMQALAPQVITTFYTPNLYAYNLSFVGQQVNYAATIAIVMGVVTAVIAYVVQLRGTKES